MCAVHILCVCVCACVCVCVCVFMCRILIPIIFIFWYVYSCDIFFFYAWAVCLVWGAYTVRVRTVRYVLCAFTNTLHTVWCTPTHTHTHTHTHTLTHTWGFLFVQGACVHARLSRLVYATRDIKSGLPPSFPRPPPSRMCSLTRMRSLTRMCFLTSKVTRILSKCIAVCHQDPKP